MQVTSSFRSSLLIASKGYPSAEDIRRGTLRSSSKEARAADQGEATKCERKDRSQSTYHDNKTLQAGLISYQESDTGLAPPHLWDVAADRQRMSEEQPLQVARCTKIIQDEKDPEKSKYVINVKQIAKFVVNLGERVSPTDIEEGMRVG